MRGLFRYTEQHILSYSITTYFFPSCWFLTYSFSPLRSSSSDDTHNHNHNHNKLRGLNIAGCSVGPFGIKMLSRTAPSLSSLIIHFPEQMALIDALYSLYQTRGTTITYDTILININSTSHQPEGIRRALEMTQPPSSYQITKLRLSGEEAFSCIPMLLPYCISKLCYLEVAGDPTKEKMDISLLSKLIQPSGPLQVLMLVSFRFIIVGYPFLSSLYLVLYLISLHTFL